MAEPLVLTLSCADRPGITAQVTGLLFEHGGNILEAQQFNDRTSDAFFMRIAFDPGGTSVENFRAAVAPFAERSAMAWKLVRRDMGRSVSALRQTMARLIASALNGLPGAPS